MIERKSYEGIQVVRNSFHQTSKVKENVIPVNHHIDYQNRFRTSDSFNLSQRPSNIEHHQYGKQMLPVMQTRTVSPPSMINVRSLSNKKPEFIELGGSKQKRSSRDKYFYQMDESRNVEISTNEVNLRKISMLEGRVIELHKEKQFIATELNEKINRLQYENTKLTQIIKTYEQQKSKTSSISPQGNEEFNFEEMLSEQIDINLGLREELQAKKLQTDNTSFRVQQIQNKCQQLYLEHNQERQTINTQLNCITQQNEGLKVRIQQLENHQRKREGNIQELIQEKQKRILQLEEQLFSLDSSLKVKESLINEIGQELSSFKLSEMKNMDQIQELKKKVSKMCKQSQEQCKKCKQYKHTIFRLNSQLNKK